MAALFRANFLTETRRLEEQLLVATLMCVAHVGGERFSIVGLTHCSILGVFCNLDVTSQCSSTEHSVMVDWKWSR